MDPIETKPRLDLPAEVLTTLAEIGEQINASLDLDEVLSHTAELVRKIIDYEIFSVLLLDEQTQSLSHRFAIGYSLDAARSWQIPLGQGITGIAAATGKPIRVGDVRNDSRHINLIESVRSELAVPMMYKSRVVGVMDLESPQLNYFTADHVQVLSILAAHLAVSIENARLYEQVARDESRMERDLNAARRIQGALLPRLPGSEFGLEIAARVVSSRELSGDLYDFLRYGPQDLGIALGDVSGKGSAAALYGAVAVGTLRSLGSQKPRPANMLRALNGFLGERLIEGRFMTLCFATWHRRHRRLRVANAGQEQPLLFHGGTCEKIQLAGFPLGIFEEVSYDERTFILDPNDIVVFYSDGIGDAQGLGGEFFGHKRVAEIVTQNQHLSADGIADKILELVDAFSGGQHPADDRTLIVLKVK